MPRSLAEQVQDRSLHGDLAVRDHVSASAVRQVLIDEFGATFDEKAKTARLLDGSEISQAERWHVPTAHDTEPRIADVLQEYTYNEIGDKVYKPLKPVVRSNDPIKINVLLATAPASKELVRVPGRPAVWLPIIK